jgi:hypothetical protein
VEAERCLSQEIQVVLVVAVAVILVQVGLEPQDKAMPAELLAVDLAVVLVAVLVPLVATAGLRMEAQGGLELVHL